MAKGPWQFSYTYADVAQLVGGTVPWVKRAKRRKEFDPNSLTSVIEWVEEQRRAAAWATYHQTPRPQEEST